MSKSGAIMGAILIALLLQTLSEPINEGLAEATNLEYLSPKLSGIDIQPMGFKFGYTDSQYTSEYGLLSSADLNSGTTTVNRPNWMWIVDGMLGTSQTITLSLNNNGQTTSGTFNVEVVVIHNEYTDFQIYSGTHSVGSIGAGGTGDIQFTWVPDYAGNHTIIARSMHSQDDNPNNDQLSRHYTIGFLYQNANSLSGWTVPANNQWYQDIDTGISPTDFASAKNSFHFGTEGLASSSQYGNGWNADLTSPTYDMSDRHPNPTSSYGIGFLFTGSVDAADPMSVEVWDGTTWLTLVSVTGEVDRNANNWQILIGNDNIASVQVPWQPIPVTALNSATKFRFNFQSDASTTDTGYWIDDIVMFYDQAVKPDEFEVSIGSNGGGSAKSGEWSDQIVTIHNDAELTDYIIPEVKNLPADWDWRILQESGTNVDLQNGVEIPRKSSKNIRIQVKPGPNATVAIQNYTLDIKSASNPLKSDTKIIPMTVLPSFKPEIIHPDSPPTCPPGNYCEFMIDLLNAGDDEDIFTIDATIFYLRSGWTLGLSPEQSTTIFVESGEIVQIKFSVNIPSTALPGQYSSIDLKVTSQTDPTAHHSVNINATAAMVSNAEIGIDYSDKDRSDTWIVYPNEEIMLPITIWNNASQQDYFTLSLEKTGGMSWDVEFTMNDEFVLYPGTKLDIEIMLTAPVNAQAGDPGPLLRINAYSSLSGMNITSGDLDLVRVGVVDDLVLRNTDVNDFEIEPEKATPFEFEIENDGNGPTTAFIDVTGLRNGWNYWIDTEYEHNVSEIELSPSYEGNDVINFTLWVVAPEYEDAGEQFSMIVSTYGKESSIEISQNDNLVEIEGNIAEIRNPVFANEILANINSSAGSKSEIMLIVKSEGNIFDVGNKIKIDLIGSDSYGITVDLIVQNDPTRVSSEGSWLSIPIGPDEEIPLILNINIPSTVSLNSVVEFRILLQSGFGQNGGYSTVEHILTVDVNQFRYVVVQTSLQSGTIEENKKLDFYINASSNSNVNEVLTITNNIPEGWELNCVDDANDGEFTQVLPPAVGTTPRTSTNKCTILAKAPFMNGEILLKITNSDGDIIHTHVSQLAIQSPTIKGTEILGINSEDIGTKEIVVSVVTIFLAAVVVMLLITIRKNKFEDEDEYEEENVTSQNFSAPSHTTQQPVQQQTYQQPVQQQTYQQPVQQQTYQQPVQQQTYQQPVQQQTYQQPVQQPVKQATQATNLSTAFDSLLSSDKQSEEQKNNNSVITPDITADTKVEINQERPMNTEIMPQLTCMISGESLTVSSKIHGCKGCGGYSKLELAKQHDSCPRCRFKW